MFKAQEQLKTQCGWQVNRGGILHQVRAALGGGTRILTISEDSSYKDTLNLLKAEFSIKPDDEARLASFDGRPVPEDVGFGEWVRGRKPKSYPRIYIVTNEKW